MALFINNDSKDIECDNCGNKLFTEETLGYYNYEKDKLYKKVSIHRLVCSKCHKTVDWIDLNKTKIIDQSNDI